MLLIFYCFIIYGLALPLTTTSFAIKYLNKEFTKEDFDDPETFDMTEVSEYIKQSWYVYNHVTINLIKYGMKIVHENEGFSLKLDNEIGTPGRKIIYINDKYHYRNYRVYYETCHHVNIIRLSIDIPEKEYVFSDLSQVQLYFDMRRDFSRD